MNPKLGPIEPDKVFIHGLTEKITRDQLELNLEELMEVEVKDVAYGLDPSIAMVVYNAAAGDKHSGSFTLPDSVTNTNSDSDSNPMATLCCTEHVHIAQTQTLIPTSYFCIGQESESKSEPESVSSNVNES